MKKQFIFLIMGFLLFGILGFVISEPLPDDVELSFDIEGEVETNVVGNVLQILLGSFSGEGDGLFKVSDNLFEGVIPGVGSKRSLINVDKQGNILEADLFVGEEGGSFFINGANFEVEPNTRFRYKPDKGYLLPKNTKILDVLKPIAVEGENILFGDEAIVDGKAIFEKDSFSVLKGNAVLKDSNVEITPGNDKVKVFRSGASESKVKSYSGNYIWKKDNSLEIKSSKEGRFDVEFLQGDGVLNVRENAYLSLSVSGGDGFDVNRVFGKNNFIYNMDEGESIFRNGPNTLFLNDDYVGIHSGLNVDKVIDGDYLTAPSLLNIGVDSDSTRYNFGKNSWKFNIFGNEEDISVYNGEIKDFGDNSLFSTFENRNLKFLLDSDVGDAGLKEIAFSLKENSGDQANSIFSQAAPHFLNEMNNKDYSFTEKQKVNLIKESSLVGGKYTDNLLFAMSSPLDDFKSEGSQSNKIYDYYLGVLNMVENEVPGVEGLSYDEGYSKMSSLFEKTDFAYRDILPEVISNNRGNDLSFSYLSESFNSAAYTESPGYLKMAFDEYDMNNFNDIQNGINILNRYGNSEDGIGVSMIEPLDLTISNIRDKSSFGKEYADKLNEKVSTLYPGDAGYIARDLNKLHDIEASLEGSDVIRESIAENLNFESKYYLISGNLGSNDIYPSTFDLISEDIPDDFPRIVAEIDPSGERSTAFTLELARRNKLDDILDKDPDFFANSLKEGFNSEDYVSIKSEDDSQVFKNGVFSVDAVNEIWSNPRYGDQKIEMEEFFYDKYQSAESDEEKNFYSFFLKMDENPLLEEVSVINAKSPNIDVVKTIPGNIPNKDVISAKLYFEDDESSYYISKEYYGTQMDLKKSYVQNGGDENPVSIYQMKVGDKIIELNLELGNAGDSFSNRKEVLEGDVFDIVALRSHCYHQDNVLSRDHMAFNDKIIFNGGCWSSTQLPDLQKQYPNMQFIVETDKGHGKDSDPAILEILKLIAQGETNWDDLSEAVPEETGLVLPDSPNQALYKYVQLNR